LIVVAAIDGSDHSPPVVEHAVDMARLLGADLHILHVVHLTGFYYSALASALIDEDELEAKLLDAVWERVADSLTKVDDVEITRVGRSGYAGDTITDYADEVDARLIVIGSKGWGALKSAFLGSTSQRVLHNTSRDVLVVSG
jgi:nucleotide-binding universal stress UspA family protein